MWKEVVTRRVERYFEGREQEAGAWKVSAGQRGWRLQDRHRFLSESSFSALDEESTFFSVRLQAMKRWLSTQRWVGQG